jgi:hypothetical protein
MLFWGIYSHDLVLSRFEHDKSHHLTKFNRLHHSNPCSNHSINPHQCHLTSREMDDRTLSQRHKPNSTSYNMERLVQQLMTAGLSNSTNHKPNPIGICIQINACKCGTRGRKYIGSTWSRNTCLALPLVAAQSFLLEGLEDYQSSQRLNNNDRK